METQAKNTPMQGILGYREVMKTHDALLGQEKRTRRQMKNLIALAERYSKTPNLDGEKKAKLRDVANTWQKFL